MVIGRLRGLGAAGVRAARSLRSTRQRIEVGVALLAAVACIVAAGIQVGPALAETKIEGEKVPASMLPAIVVGATSCPAVTAPRLAAQLMAASRFQATARTDTGEGLANLNAEDWRKWAPWAEAQRSDVLASVLALAHQTCNFVGTARENGVDGSEWEAAVAGDLVGMDEVLRAGAVPEAARRHVETVAGYANWYADQPQFSDPADAEPSGSPSPPANVVKVPEELVEPIRAAGRICPGVLPASRVAAQVMALSGFNASLRGPNGGQGIAQFTESMWEQYQPSSLASVWDPAVAIPAMGTAMCDLRNQLSGLQPDDSSGDSFTLAMAAYQWGPTAVRAEGGVPRHARVKQLPDLVARYFSTYQADARLGEPKKEPVEPAKPVEPVQSGEPESKPSTSTGPSAAAPTSSSASPSPAASDQPTLPLGPGAVQPTGPKIWDTATEFQIANVLSGRVMDVPGKNTITAAHTTIQLYDNDKGADQRWRIANASDPKYVVITNVHSGKVLGMRGGKRENGVELVMTNRVAGDFNQQFRLQPLGVGSYAMINRRSGRALDIMGNDCCANNATPITQWDLQTKEVDMRWSIKPIAKPKS